MPITFRAPGSSAHPDPRDNWVPKLGTGHFYINDRAHYLYAEKRTRTLRDATVLIFELAEVPVSGSASVLIEGIAYANFVVNGNELHLKMDDQESFSAFWSAMQYDLTKWGFVDYGFGFAPSNEVAITYQFLQWRSATDYSEPTANTYATQTITQTFKIKDADRITYQLTTQDLVEPSGSLGLLVPSGFVSDIPQDRAPVVITDDSIENSDERGFQTEFRVDYADGTIDFNAARNYVQNPSLEIRSTGMIFDQPLYPYPLEWEVTDPGAILPVTGEAYHGNYCYQLTGSGQLLQTVSVDPDQEWSVTARFTDGIGKLCVNFLDSSKRYIDTTGGLIGQAQPNYAQCLYSATNPSSSGWDVASLYFGTVSAVECTGETVYTIPGNVVEFEVKLLRESGNPCTDAIMVEQGRPYTDFEPLDPNITIEYETLTRGYWTIPPSGLLPFEAQDLDVNPINVPVPGGYLIAEEFSNVEDFQLGIGGLAEGAVTSPSGILDLTGEIDVNFGRQHLPYAKTSGFTKFRQRKTFHLQNPLPIMDVTDLTIPNGNPLPVPAAIEYAQREGFAVVGSQLRLYVVPDERLPVRIDAFILDQHSNPAFVWLSRITTTAGVINPPDPVTSHSGQIFFDFIPPTIAGTGDLGLIATIRIQVGDVVDQLPVYGYRPPGVDYDDYFA